MNIHELLEQVEMEAATQAEYVPEFQEAVTTAIKESLRHLAEESMKASHFDDPLVRFNRENPWPAPLITALKGALYWLLDDKISEALRRTANKIYVPKDQVTAVHSVRFVDTKYGGYANRQNISISDRNLIKLKEVIIEEALDRTYSSHSGGLRSEELQRQLLDMSKGYWRTSVDNLVVEIVDVFVHEITHTEQHRPQWRRGSGHGLGPTEYRSYLDDPRNPKFHDLHSEHEKKTLTPAEQQRYLELYYASPQEIAAFSNNLATKIAREWGVFEADSLQHLEDILRHDPRQGLNGLLNSPRDIESYIKSQTGDLFQKQPGETPRTARLRQQVWRRYVTRTYQSLRAIVDSQRERIRAKQQQQQNREEP